MRNFFAKLDSSVASRRTRRRHRAVPSCKTETDKPPQERTVYCAQYLFLRARYVAKQKNFARRIAAACHYQRAAGWVDGGMAEQNSAYVAEA